MLRARPLGEADRIYRLFTTERGKIDAVAKGVRRAKSHLAGRLEFGNEVRATMHHGRSLDVIVTADILSASWEALVIPERFAAASVAVELIDAFCEPDLALPDVFALLKGGLAAIATAPDPQSVLPRFQMRLLSVLGLEPPAQHCIRCGRPFSGAHAWVDPDAGGFICDLCRERWRDLAELDAEDLENVRALSAARGSGAALNARANVRRAVDVLITHHLGRKPKAGVALSEFVTRPR